MTKEEWLRLAEKWEKMSPEERNIEWLKHHPDAGHHTHHAIDIIDKHDWDDYLYAKNPTDNTTIVKKTILPPTEKQIERIKELKDRPEFTEHLDWLLTAIEVNKMLNTRGQAGKLIDMMKKRIVAAGGVIKVDDLNEGG